MGCVALQPFATGGNRLYLDIEGVTGGPRYPGYTTQVSSENTIHVNYNLISKSSQKFPLQF
jgi:hypothetical protein